MSGKNYREVQHHATHRAMKTSRSSLCSLADKGFNEGVEDVNVRVIETYHGHNVDIRGTYSHEITSIPLKSTGSTTTLTTTSN